MMQRILIAGGGTGGHFFPAVAIVEELRRRRPHLDVTFVGTRGGIEARLLPSLGERFEVIDVAPLRGRSACQKMAALGSLPASMARASALLRRHRPDVVLGVGGYASGPMLLAASLLRLRTALMEQNAVTGFTNRMLAPWVDRAYLSAPDSAGHFAARRVRLAGNPVRRAFVQAARRAMVDPQGFEAHCRRIVVLGGSQGAATLNRLVPDALAAAGVGRSGNDIEVLHQAGERACEQVAARYGQLGIRAQVQPFWHDMAAVYASAKLVIARAGATSLAEICAVGRPAILVPYPFAADDHQRLNAQVLAAAGAALTLRETPALAEQLAASTRQLLQDDALRLGMAQDARRHGKPEAAAQVVDDLLDWLEGAAAPRPVQALPSRWAYPSSAAASRHSAWAQPVCDLAS